MIWNPFAILVKNKRYPYSHIVSSNLMERFEDMLGIFYGSLFQSKIRMGILDYCLIVSRPAERLIEAIFDYQISENNPVLYFLSMLPLIPLFLIFIPKLILGFILTIACSPITLGVHLFMQPIKYYLNKKADRIWVKKIPEQNGFNGDTPRKFSYKHMHLIVPGISHELNAIPTDQDVTLNTLNEESEELQIDLFIEDKNCGEIFVGIRNLSVFFKLFNALGCAGAGPFSGLVGIFALDEENLEAVRMALHLNRFRITDAAREAGYLPFLEEKMQAIDKVRHIRRSMSEALCFPDPILKITFCYAGIANRMQIQEFDKAAKSTDTRTPPKQVSRVHSSQKKIT